MTDASLPEPRMLVVGMGGLGGTFAGWLHQLEGAGIRELVALTRNKDTIAAVAEQNKLATKSISGYQNEGCSVM